MESISFRPGALSHSIVVAFNAPIDAASVSPADIIVERAGDDARVPPNSISATVNPSHTEVIFSRTDGFDAGDYDVTLKREDILDVNSAPLDADAGYQFFFQYGDITGPNGVRDRISDTWDADLIQDNLGLTPATYLDGDLDGDGVVTSNDTAAVGGVTLETPIDGASGLTVTELSPGNIQLSWVDGSTTNTGFRIQRSADGGRTFVASAPTTLYTNNANTISTMLTSANVDAMVRGQDYIFRIRSVEAPNPFNGVRPPSRYFATTFHYGSTASQPIETPSPLTITSVAKNTISLSWIDNSSDETGIEVWRSTDGGSNYSHRFTLNEENATTWIDRGLKASKRYDYKVRAISNSSTSAFSSAAHETTLAGAPVVLSGDLETGNPQQVVAEFDQPILANVPSLTGSHVAIYSLTGGRQFVDGSDFSTVTVAGDRLRVQLAGLLRSGSSLTGVLPDGNYEIIVRGDAVKNAAGETIADAGHPDLEGIGQTFFFAGDFNHDRSVNFADLVVLAQNYGLTGRTFEQGDSDYDGDVDFDDLVLMTQRYQSTYPAPLAGVSSLQASTGPLADPNFDPLGTANPSNAAYVEWTAPAAGEGAFEGYKIWRSIDGVNFGSAISTLPITQLNFIDRGLLEGERYTYRVRPYRSDGSYGVATNKAAVVTTLPAPTEVSVSSKIDGTLVVTWQDEALNESSYQLDVLDNSGAIVQTQSLPSNSETALISGLTLWSEYTIRLSVKSASAVGRVPDVRAIAGMGASQHEITLHSMGVAPGRIALRWTASDLPSGETFRIFRAATEAELISAPMPIANLSGATHFIDSSASVGKSYYYRVVALHVDATLSSPSNVASAIAVNQDDDIDNDGIKNPADNDSDNDGIANEIDADLDNDGVPNASDKDDGDADGDEIMDWSDTDNDNDGVLDPLDFDNDNDAVNDLPDADDDNDGTLDGEERSDLDSDNDGIEDANDPDDDNDGQADAADPDDDNDGLSDNADFVLTEYDAAESRRITENFDNAPLSLLGYSASSMSPWLAAHSGFRLSTSSLQWFSQPEPRAGSAVDVYFMNNFSNGPMVVDFEAPVKGLRLEGGSWESLTAHMTYPFNQTRGPSLDAVLTAYYEGALVGSRMLIGDGRLLPFSSGQTTDDYIQMDFSSCGLIDQLVITPTGRWGRLLNGQDVYDVDFGYYDSFSFIPLKPDLAIDGVGEEAEESVGGSVPVNSDDDDSDGVVDGEQNGSVSGEDDLIAMELTLPDEIDDGQLRLSLTGGVGNIKVWTNPTRSGSPILGGADLSETWNVHAQPSVVYVEATDAVEANLVLAYKKSSATGFPDLGPAVDAVKLYGVSTSFINSEGNELDTLKVSKWKGAFNFMQGGVQEAFIDDDPDMFKVRVKDMLKAGAETITVKISTDSAGTDYDDNPTELTLHETGVKTGIFESQAEILVSDDVDDDYVWRKPGVNDDLADDVKNDRTHIVALNGKVKVEYTHASGKSTTESTAKVPAVKTLKLHPTILRLTPGGAPVVSVAEVEADIREVRERFAQVGIAIEAGVPIVVDPPDGVDLSNGFSPFLGYNEGKAIFTDEENSLFFDQNGIRTPALDDIEIYYVNNMTQTLGRSYLKSTAPIQLAGPSPNERTYNNIVVSAERVKFATLAHEVGHILGFEQHYEVMVDQNFNLMRAGGEDATDTVDGPKRLNESQAITMLASELLVG